LSVVNVVRSQV